MRPFHFAPRLLLIALAASALTACGGGGSESAPTAVLSAGTSSPTPSNRAPVANAGTTQSVLLSREVFLDGSTSTDPDLDPLTYSWTITSRPDGSRAFLSGANTARPTFVPDAAGRYLVTLTVSDGRAASAPSVAIIEAGTGNVPPTADAGRARTVVTGTVVSLTGAASADANGDVLAFTWVLSRRPPGSTAALDGPGTVAPVFTADVAGEFEATLIVSDGKAVSEPAKVAITVVPPSSNAAPVAMAGVGNSAVVGRVVQLDASGSYDANGDPLSYAWTLTSKPVGSIAVLSGAATLWPTLVPDQPGVYVATLIVSDGRLASLPASVVVSAVSPATLPTSAFIRAGGESVSTVDGRVFAADRYYSGGNTAATTVPMSGTLDDAVYQKERWGDFSYSIPLADGQYRVTLHQSERFSGITGTGQRVFDVRFEPGEAGDQFVRDIDIYGSVGPNAAYDVDRTVVVRGGTLDIQFLRKVQEPKVAAISVVPESQAPARPSRLGIAMQKALRLLAGQSTLNCGYTVTARLADSMFSLGGTTFPSGNLNSIAFSTFRDGTLGASLTYSSAGVDQTVGLSFDSAGVLIRLQSGGTTCTATGSARWGVFDGDARRLMDGVEKPRPNYADELMACTYSAPNLSGPVGTLLVGARDYRLSIRNPDGSAVNAGTADLWRDYEQPEGKSFYSYSLTLRPSGLESRYTRDLYSGSAGELGTDVADRLKRAANPMLKASLYTCVR